MNSYISNSNLTPQYSFLPFPIPYLYLPTETSLAPNNKIVFIQFFNPTVYTKWFQNFLIHTKQKIIKKSSKFKVSFFVVVFVCVYSFVVFKLRVYNQSTKSYELMVFKIISVNIFRRIQSASSYSSTLVLIMR